MQQNQINQPICYEEDEIDLRELFKTLMRYKRFIALFTFGITFAVAIFLFFYNPTPIYKGSVTL